VKSLFSKFFNGIYAWLESVVITLNLWQLILSIPGYFISRATPGTGGINPSVNTTKGALHLKSDFADQFITDFFACCQGLSFFGIMEDSTF